MSRAVATLVYAKQAGSMARKAVLAYFADRANDDGTGIRRIEALLPDDGDLAANVAHACADIARRVKERIVAVPTETGAAT